DGMLADLGVSSHQFDEAARGFSIRFDASLDMRMDQRQKITAAEIIKNFTELQLHKMLEQYGEVTNAKTLAKTIVQQRALMPIKTINEFKQAVQSVVKGNPQKYFAQVFQALRIEVNDELGALKELLQQSPGLLKPGGRIAIITFHSLEDRIVKNFFKQGNLTEADIDELGNTLYPFMVTATCEFGRQDDPAQISSAELSLLHSKGGAIGLVSTARPVNSSTNFELNQAFYEALFQKESNHYLTIGEIFRRTKNNSTSGVSNRNFSLLADPSLTLALPTNHIVVTELKTTSGSDTLKALSRVIVKGEVQDEGGVILSNFSGTLQATLFDKQTQFVTIGKNNPAFAFKEWYNSLFRGQANVTNGTFEFEFILPKNMAYEVGSGKLSLYAVDPTQRIDAAGAAIDFSVGGSEPLPTLDNIAPTLQAFIGDTTFVNGGITNPNTKLLVYLKDSGGINISSYGIGNNLMASLDNGEFFNLNDYYTAESNDFTAGWIDFPLNNLSPGNHSLTVKAWDTSNNGAETSLNFRVTDGEEIVVEQFGNYPNPFDEKTTFFFTHNRSGDDLEIELSLYSAYGQELKTYSFSEISSSYQVDFPEFDTVLEFGEKLPPGLYLARLAVRSLSNGSKYERVAKLIVVN
ncbi:MAG: type IX secretion system sortase PorU, partial [Chryseolinea sp.]